MLMNMYAHPLNIGEVVARLFINDLGTIIYHVRKLLSKIIGNVAGRGVQANWPRSNPTLFPLPYVTGQGCERGAFSSRWPP